MEEYGEEGPSLPEERPIYGGYKGRLLKNYLAETPPTLYNIVKGPGRQPIITEMGEKLRVYEVPVCGQSLPQSRINPLRNDLKNLDKVVYVYDENPDAIPPEVVKDLPNLSNCVTINNIQSLVKAQPACTVADLSKASSTKSTLVYFPMNMKLTDKHLAEMVPNPKSPTDIIWPRRWQFDEKLGSFVCVVERIDKYNYEFKVMMMPGSYTDDPVTLAMLMKLFNPLYQVTHTKDKREAALKKANVMVASAANEFFGPQIVESCIAVWLSCRQDQHINIKKSNIIIKMKNFNQLEPSVSDENISETSSDPVASEIKQNTTIFENVPIRSIHQPIGNKLATTTKYANYLTAVFGYNRAMYPNVRSLTTPYAMSPMYDYIREIHVNEEQLYQLLAEICPLKAVSADVRMKG